MIISEMQAHTIHIYVCSDLSNIFLYIYLFYLFYCAGWGYTVAFTKVLSMYQVYHTAIPIL
jgi:hypothetical protein